MTHLARKTASVRLSGFAHLAKSAGFALPEKRNDQLVVSEVKFGGGLRIAKALMDPMKLNLRNEKFENGFRPLSFEESKSLWANSYALFARMRMGRETTSWPPLAFNWLHQLVEQQVIKPHLAYRCKAMGLSKNKGKVEYLREERFPFSLRYLVDEALRNLLRDALQEAEKASGFLSKSLCMTGMYLLQASADNYKWEDLRINVQNDGIHRDEIPKCRQGGDYWPLGERPTEKAGMDHPHRSRHLLLVGLRCTLPGVYRPLGRPGW
ncbi:MAG: type I-E CRISPR-associated protein Cse1/CasA [Candidatus Promineofilum sp.]|nr:type I-E CRISPR-associated protein Cse1/CasA [Promineifilum sp.]